MNRTSRMSHTPRPRSRPVALLAALILTFLPSAGCAQSDPTGDPRFEQAVDLFEA